MNNKKQLPEKYAKIWQYMMDPTQPINENRIAGLLQEIFLDRFQEVEGLVKNNLKTMKVKEIFDLRGDGWKQAIIHKWETTFMPDLMDEVKDIKNTHDISDRAPKMRNFLAGAKASFSPMNVLSVMEDEYRNGQEEVPQEDVDIGDDEPGFLRRTAGYVGGTAKAAAGGLAYAAMSQTKLLGGIVKGASAIYGLHRAAKNIAASSKTSGATGRLGRSVKGLFGVGKSNVRTKTNVDFTPREEQIEGERAIDVLKKIEDNTQKLLEVFGKEPGEKKKGILSTLLSGLSSVFGRFMGPLRNVLSTLATLLPNITTLVTGALRALGLLATPAGAAAAAGAAALLTPGNAFEDLDKIRREDAYIDKGNVGWLYRKNDAGKEGYAAINKKSGAYGGYQFMKGAGLESFMSKLKKEAGREGANKNLVGAYKELSASKPGSEQFNKAWQKWAKTPEFNRMQDRVAKEEYFFPALDRLNKKGVKSSPGMDEFIFSRAGHMGVGGVNQFFDSMIAGYNRDHPEMPFDKLSANDQLKALKPYQEGAIKEMKVKDQKGNWAPISEERKSEFLGRTKDLDEAVAFNEMPKEKQQQITTENSPTTITKSTKGFDLVFDDKSPTGYTTSNQSLVSPRSKPAPQKAATITPREDIATKKSSETAPVIVAPQNNTSAGGGRSNPSHYPTDVSALKLQMENNQNAIPH